MTRNLYKSRPPDIEELLDVTTRHKLRFVLVGSVAALAYGVDIREPGDLDIVPSLERENLERLVSILEEIEAAPHVLGHWEKMENGELKWFLDDDSAEVPLRWQPELDDINSLDHLFYTKLGNYDVVPRISGDYEFLRAHSSKRTIAGIHLQVMHIDELLARLTVPRRDKDVERVKLLREIQRDLRT